MKVTYKLVGIKGDYHFSREHDVEFVNLDTFKNDISKIGFDGDHSKIIFITQSKTVKSNEIKFTLPASIVFVFSKEVDVKIKLKEVFEKNSESSPLPVVKPVSRTVSTSSFAVIPAQDVKKPVEIKIPTLEDEKMIKHNEDILKVLQDNDFITLMRIYHNKPELLSFMYNYVSSGNIIDMKELKEVDSELTEEETKVFSEIKTLVSSFSFDVDDNMIKKLIREFNGNCSLIFRYLYQVNLTPKE